MSQMSWADALEYVSRYVVRVATPNSHGTGFIIAKRVSARDPSSPAQTSVATAFHVVRDALEAGQPITLQPLASDSHVEIKPIDLELLVKPERDLALIHCSEDSLRIPGDPPQLAGAALRLRPASEIGWCGFPHVDRVGDETLCFFCGHVSALWTQYNDYLVDGVAIHGVSGGPAFVRENGTVSIIGLVTEYIPNLAVRDRALPGVVLIRTVGDIVWLFDQMAADAADIRETEGGKSP